jgi:hypothetical protein
MSAKSGYIDRTSLLLYSYITPPQNRETARGSEVTISEECTWAGHVARMGEKRNTYRLLWESQRERDH